MEIYKKLGISKVNKFMYNSLNDSIKKNYKIDNDISFYNPNLILFTNYFKQEITLNYKHKLVRLYKKKVRINTIGFCYKALIKYYNTTYFTNVFVKEIPIFSPSTLTLINKKTDKISPLNNKFNSIVYDINSSINIEILVNYLVSKLNEYNLSPTFCKCYGCYLVNMKKFSYSIGDTPEYKDYFSSKENNYISDKIEIYETYNDTLLQLNHTPIYLLATEKGDFDMDFLIHKNLLDYEKLPLNLFK